jgi:hypothetical protein
MVTKITPSDDTLENIIEPTFQSKMLEYMQAMDWKLWELLKIEQARAIKEDLNLNQLPVSPSVNTSDWPEDFSPIIIEEE